VPPARFPLREAPGSAESSHFRAHARKPVRLSAIVRSERGDWERTANVIDVHLAGAGIETEEPLTAGERVSVAFSTPTLWDPLVLSAVIAWAHPLVAKGGLDPLGRPRMSARAGLAFDYATPDATLAMFEMLVAVDFE
jgi:hypothetical protein